MCKKYFTVENINEQIKHIKLCMFKIEQIKWLTQKYTNFILDSELIIKKTDEKQKTEILDDYYTLRVLINELKKLIDDLKDRGCILDDIYDGILKWPSKGTSGPFLISWQIGEESILYGQEYSKKSRLPIKDFFSDSEEGDKNNIQEETEQ